MEVIGGSKIKKIEKNMLEGLIKEIKNKMWEIKVEI
jgi:hypothetical protein